MGNSVTATVWLACVLGSAGVAYAAQDVVITTSGDRLVGEIKSVAKDVLTLETDYSDAYVKIKWDKIASIESDRQFLVETFDGKRVSGSLKPDPAKKSVVQIAETSVPLPEVAAVQPFERTFWSRFDAGLDFGYSMTRTNSAKQLSLGTNLSYRDEHHVDVRFANVFRSTQGLSLSGSSDSVQGPSSMCGTCLPGTVLSHSGTVFGVSGTGTLNGATYPFNPGTGGTGMLTIVAPTFTLPPPAGGEATFETPFILTPDSFLVFAFDPNVIRLPVAGSGRATTRFIITDEPALGLVYTTQGITYEFDPSPAAVPEPASLLLVGGGLAAVWARRRRARNVAR